MSRLGVIQENGENKISAILETIVFLCESDASDKDVRALALSMAKRQLEEQKTRMKKVRKDLKACHTS